MTLALCRVLTELMRPGSGTASRAYVRGVQGLGHGLLGLGLLAVLGGLGVVAGAAVRITAALVYWRLKEWRDLRRGGAMRDGIEDTGFVLWGLSHGILGWQVWSVGLLTLGFAAMVSEEYWSRRPPGPIVSRLFLKGWRAGVWSVLLLGGALFMGPAWSGSFVMDAHTYGELVVSIPAEAWASILFGGSLVYLIMLAVNGDWYRSWIVRVAAALIVSIKFAFFVVSAVRTGGHDIVILFGAAFLVCILTTVWIDAREGVAYRGRPPGADA